MQVLAVLLEQRPWNGRKGGRGERERESEGGVQRGLSSVSCEAGGFRFNMLLPNGLARDRCYKICVRGRFNVGVLDGEIVSLLLTGSHSLDVVRDRNLSLAKDLSWALIVKG